MSDSALVMSVLAAAVIGCSSPASPTPAPGTPATTTSNPPGTGALAAASGGAAKNPEPNGPLLGMLSAHNRARDAHCANPLEWSAKLTVVAQRWADSLRDNDCAFEHSPGFKYGENLAYAAPAGSSSVNRVVGGWYQEVELYDFGAAKFSFESGHFTQVVWRATRRLGCGYAACGSNAELWVCNYDPPGNVTGAFARNVLPTSCKE